MERVPATQQTVGAVMQKLLGSGKVTDSGVFVDDRAGFLLVNVDSAEELFDLAQSQHPRYEVQTGETNSA